MEVISLEVLIKQLPVRLEIKQRIVKKGLTGAALHSSIIIDLMTSEIIETTPDCEIVSSRIVNAPIETVFTAWADPQHLKNWWGPKGFTNTFNEFDLRPGGIWSFVMHGPERGNYRNECEFIKIEKPTLIAWKRHSKPLFRVVAAFEEIAAEQTRIVFRQIFDSAAECDKIRAFVVDKNEENFDRLEAELEKMVS